MKTKERPRTPLDDMLDSQMELLYNIQEYKKSTEYSTINMNMVNICKELNAMRIKEITKETIEQ
jgi:hypothetical protein